MPPARRSRHRLSLTYGEALRFLYPRTTGGTKWSLDPTRRLLERLGHPERHFEVLHIGGTNGKGSVAVMCYEALRAAGRRAALYTSPHLVDVRERMIVDGRPITEAAFAQWTTELEHTIRTEGASFFEATTAIALADVAARGAEVAVVEVGLGGRLDSTNVLTPQVSAVTIVAREHVEYLGEALEGIAREKAGIAKPGRPFVIGETDPGLVNALIDAACGVGALPVVVPPEARYVESLALEGVHQRRNAAVAWAVLDALPAGWQPDADARARGFAVARLPGRFDRRGRWILDVAHNPAGVATLCAALATATPPRPLHAVVGILRDKDWRAMIELLRAVVDRIWVTQPPTAPPERRWDPDEVGRAVPGVIVEPDLMRALDDAARDAQTVLVTGSFHTVGDAMARLPGFRPLG